MSGVYTTFPDEFESEASDSLAPAFLAVMMTGLQSSLGQLRLPRI